jgi:hypothetical protein
MKSIDFVSKAGAFCRAKSSIALAGTIIGFTQLAIELLVDPEGNQVSSSEIVLLHINNGEASDGDALIGRRAYLGDDLEELLVTYDAAATALKVSSAFRSGHSQELTIPLDGSGVTGEAAFGNSTEIFILQACGARFGAVSVIVEVKAILGVSASTKASFLSQFQASAELATSIEVQAFGIFKQEIPLLAVRLGPGGLDSTFLGTPIR